MSLSNWQQQANYVAGDTIYEGSLVAYGSNENEVVLATAAAAVAGVVPLGKGKALENYEHATHGNIRALAGDEVPVTELGHVLVRTAANLSIGDEVEAGANGQVAAKAAGVTVGICLSDSVGGKIEFVRIRLQPGLA